MPAGKEYSNIHNLVDFRIRVSKGVAPRQGRLLLALFPDIPQMIDETRAMNCKRILSAAMAITAFCNREYNAARISTRRNWRVHSVNGHRKGITFRSSDNGPFSDG